MNTIEEAIKKINQYINSKAAYPYFIVVDGSNEYNRLLYYYQSLQKVKVSDYCGDNSFPNFDALFDDLVSLSGNKMLIGLGECLMLSGNEHMLGRLKDVSLHGKTLVICKGIRSSIKKLNEIDRKFNFRRYCEVDSELDYSVVRVNPKIKYEAYPDFKSLIIDLENGKNGELFVHTDLDIRSARSISSPYEAIVEKNPGFVVNEASLSEKEWEDYNNDNNLKGYSLSHWRTYLKMRIDSTDNQYLQLVMKLAPDYESYKHILFDALLEVPVNHNTFWTLYKERKELLRDEDVLFASKYVANTEQKGDDRVCYLTDNTAIERYAIIREISKTKVLPKYLNCIYPELGMYLNDYAFKCIMGDDLTQYFIDYKRQKLFNQIDEDFLQLVYKLSSDGNRLYNKLESKGELIEKLDDGKNILYWVDALGVEYLGYIQALAKELDLIITIQVGRAVLPSLTYLNKDFYDDWRGKKAQTKKLDKIKHEGEESFNYESEKYPIHLAAELKIINDTFRWAKNELLQNPATTVVIASDHGASRLAVINEQENKWEMATKGIHSGRCCPINEIDERPNTATEERGYWVLANYDRFKGGRKASVEVHGGASLEEVLVPIIQIRLNKESIELKNMTPISWSSWDEDPYIDIFSPATIDSLTLKFNNRLYKSISVDEKTHRVVFDDFKRSGTYTADVLDGDNIIGSISFTIEKRSGKTNKKVEDDFFNF